MAEADASLSPKQRSRLRELAKYYGARTLSPSAPDPNHEYHDETEQRPFEMLPPRLSVDANLTALAQSATFRLRCERAFISLIDDKYQHILAEATQSISTFDPEDHAPGDGLLIGAQSLPLGFGFCPKTMNAFLKDDDLALTQPNNKACTDYVLMEDVLAESSMLSCPAVTASGMLLRYYLEVPLLSDVGHVVGSLCVVDSQPRTPREGDVRKLQEVAKLVVHHLQRTRMQDDHRRAERLLQGLAQFNTGQHSISDWSKTTPGQTIIPPVRSEPTELSMNKMNSLPYPGVDASVGTMLDSTSTVMLTESASHSAELPLSSATLDTPPTSQKSQSVQSIVSSTNDTEVQADLNFLEESGTVDDVQTSTSTASKIREVFSRAANLLCESMDLDAACFLEVPQNERYKVVRKDQHLKTSDENYQTGTDSTNTPYLSDAENKEQKLNIGPRTPSTPVYCDLLGFSTHVRSSIAHSAATQAQLSITADLLSSLVARYSNGYIFHFDAAMQASSRPDTEVVDYQSADSARDEGLSTRLSLQFPAARSMIFYPLYDNDKQQIYAGFLGYTTDPTRALQKYEVVYVSGFANSIMCEVMRLETVALDSAKSDFISSISHELRSPLHGILGAGQLLTESNQYPQQAEYIQMVTSCARTLMDTIDQLLDHAKINQFTKTQAKSRSSNPTKRMTKRPHTSRLKTETFSLVTDIDFLSLMEETLVSVVGNGYQELESNGRRSSMALIDGEPQQRRRNIPVILNVPYSKTWSFRSEAGSWRRVIMNLVGNALKYTDEGFVEVQLTPNVPKSQEKDRFIEFRVKDTGRGISEGFLKHRLYSPFAQENNLSVGAGLGLSLVRQIVSSLHGTIDVQSEVGTGTDIRVRVPVEATTSTSNLAHDQKLLAMTKARTFCVVGFSDWPSLDEQPTGIITPQSQSLLLMKEVLIRMLVDCFGMELVNCQAAVHIIQESVLTEEFEKYDRQDRDLFIIGMNGRTTLTSRIQYANYVYMLPPIGPIRIGQALQTLLETRQKRTMKLQPIDRPDSSASGDPTSNQPELLTDTESIRPFSSFEFPIALPNRSKTKLAVLLVDDNDINLRLLVGCVKRLKSTQLSYITAINGRDALDKYISYVESGVRIPLVLMDISMPVMDGCTSTRKIRAFEKRMKVSQELQSKIVALTGLASADAQNEISSSGFDLYYRKPVDLKAVRTLIESCL